MAMLRYGHAAVSTPIVAPEKWLDKKVPAGRVKVARNMIASYDPSKWLLSHVSIIASVDTEFADPKDKKSNYLIIPEHSQFVNNNGDCWERDLLKKTYKTFLNADNFCEHVQIPELSKGKVIDVALREIPVAKDPYGKDITTLYVDILIATNKMHSLLIDQIKTGEYSAVSMGCLIAYSQCSKCGNIAADEPDLCKHVRYYKHNFFHDKNGVKRIIAELCGRAEDPDSCKFVDASWVRKPAFEGAVLRNLVEPGDDVAEKIQTAISVPSFKAEPGMILRAASSQASTLMREINAAKEEAPAPPADDVDFPPAGDEGGKPLELDQPPAEGGGEAPAEDSGAAPGGDLGADLGAAPEPQIQEPEEDANVKEVADMMRRQVLNDIRRDLLKDEAKLRVQEQDRPLNSETEERDALIREASKRHQRLMLAAKKIDNPKLINGVMILSNLKKGDWKAFKKYGYSRDDMLALLSFTDRTMSESPVEIDMVKAMSRIKTANQDPTSFFTKVILETGRRPSAYHGKKMLTWSNILSAFE